MGGSINAHFGNLTGWGVLVGGESLELPTFWV